MGDNFPRHTQVFPDLSLLPADGVIANVWSNPAMGRLTSMFGPRLHPVLGAFMHHSGTDVAAACGTPVHAAADGVVVFVGTNFQWRTGNQVVIAHGDGVVTRYGHLLSGETVVELGDEVRAGQVIAAVGGDRILDPLGAGNSTGCHLHFEVNFDQGATPVDAIAFLQALGVRLGLDEPVVPEEETTAEEGELTEEAEEIVEEVLEIRTASVDVIPGVIPEFKVRTMPQPTNPLLGTGIGG